jgi:hypothetical protein
MMRCEVCGNTTENPFRVVLDESIHFYDTLECTVFALAPPCECCGEEVLGPAIEAGETVFCSVRCAIALARAS